ncbi:hypothetical protein [Prevotella pallens]|uniref:hypothetical protein n=1 Tax=Prevotella pallens TaxID=60133 RepID=UPI00288972BB|nr:hypothetical protein [Prevotella pallens]
METIVYILFMLVCFSFLLKQTFVNTLQLSITAVAAMVFTGFAWHVAILQSSTEIAAWLANTNLVRDISVVLNIDVLLSMAFCLLAANIKIGEHVGRKARWLYAFLRFFPGIMIVPTLFALLVETIFMFPGEDFSLIAWTLGGVFCVAILLLTYTIKRLLPETFLRLELLFLCNLLIALVGIVATVNGKTAVVGTDSTNFGALAGTLALVVVVGIVGMLWQRWHNKRQMKQLE